MRMVEVCALSGDAISPFPHGRLHAIGYPSTFKSTSNISDLIVSHATELDETQSSDGR